MSDHSDRFTLRDGSLDRRADDGPMMHRRADLERLGKLALQTSDRSPDRAVAERLRLVAQVQLPRPPGFERGDP